MPQRSNDFQQLIYLIHHQIDKDVKVTESKFLLDQVANVDREVDIVIEKEIGDYSLIISIECQGRKRIASIEWVEQMVAKHQTLPTKMLILVSQSGFSKAALKKAASYGVTAMTITEAIDADWKGMAGLKNIVLCRSTVEPGACFALHSNSSGQVLSTQLEMSHQLADAAGEEFITVAELFDVFLDMSLDNYTHDQGTGVNGEPKYTVFELDCPLPNGMFYINIGDELIEVEILHFIGHEKKEYELVEMQNGSFGSSQISFGKTRNIHEDALLSIVENQERSNTAAIMIKDSKKNVEKIINLRRPKKPPYK